MRFLLCLCGMIGFSVWWAVAPDPLLNIPISVYLHDPGLILKLFRDTFVNHICSVHPDVVTPCSCGEPTKNMVREIIDEHISYDPLGLNSRRAKVLTLFTLIASIILCIALAESVSPEAVYMLICCNGLSYVNRYQLRGYSKKAEVR